MSNFKGFVKGLQAIEPTPLLWNPYNMADSKVDLPNACMIRCANLESYASAFKAPIRVLLVGEAPGAWGARFSGIAFTSERQLDEATIPVVGRRSSRFQKPCSEASGTQMWAAMRHAHGEAFLWNSLPFLPYKAGGDALTMRAPTDAEQARYAHVLDDVVQILEPAAVVAVGRRAEAQLKRLNIKHVGIRHPSMGGGPQFKASMQDLLGGPFEDKAQVLQQTKLGA